MSTPVELLVGLGNPGSRYDATRHNAGFWFVDRVAASLGVRLRASGRFRGELGEGEAGGQRLRLLKPDTFMNRSGDAVASIAGFYRYRPESILVVHDEIDLPPGTVRLKRGGGHGGHNGLRDVLLSPISLVLGLISVLGSAPHGEPFYRLLRLGRASERWIDLFGAGYEDDKDAAGQGHDLERLLRDLEAGIRERGYDQSTREGLTKARDAIARYFDNMRKPS